MLGNPKNIEKKHRVKLLQKNRVDKIIDKNLRIKKILNNKNRKTNIENK